MNFYIVHKEDRSIWADWNYPLKDYLNDYYNKELTKTIDIIQLYFNEITLAN